MSQSYKDLSELLKDSTQAEAFFAQLPERIQNQAMEHRASIHTAKDLRSFAKRCAEEA